jgi:hypothetical protein
MAPNTAGDPVERTPLVHRNADGEVELPDQPAVEPSDLEFPEEQPRVEPGFPGTIRPG